MALLQIERPAADKLLKDNGYTMPSMKVLRTCDKHTYRLRDGSDLIIKIGTNKGMLRYLHIT